MLGIIYLLMASLLGREVVHMLIKDKRTPGMSVNRIWVSAPAAFGIGVLFMTWVVYLISWVCSVTVGMKRPLLWGNLIAFVCATLLLLAARIYRKRRKEPFFLPGKAVADGRKFKKELIFFLILLVFLTWIMFFVFHERDGMLYSGFTVYGDYAPHTAMMRSFSLGNNFPTQYPHFGGEDVKYHFMFQFLTGNLEYLGMRLDLAYNCVSILSLEGFLMILYSLAQRFAGSVGGGILAVVFFFFRSGTTFFRFVMEHLQQGDLWKTLRENDAFIGYTVNEDWGLWNFNVYLNQRHLAFGLLLVALAVWVFADWLEAGTSHKERGLLWMKDRFFSVKAWQFQQVDTALLVGLILGLAAFWNGAAVIGGLLILCGFAVFSDGKLDYLVMAGMTIFLSWIQTKIFIWGSSVSPAVYFGFLSEEKTVVGVAGYLICISGFVFLGIFLLFPFMKRRERAAAVACLFPVAFAFVMSLTPDIAVNHKYIMIGYAFITVFWGNAIVKLFRRRKAGKLVAVIMAVCLTITGLYDFVIIVRRNDFGHRVAVAMESELTDWLADHLKKDDLLLTPEYSMNEVTMSGAMMYLGWPYYAWSAGYDTFYRAEQAVTMYTTDDPRLLKKTAEEEGITYILYEEGMEMETHPCREDVIASCYPLVYKSKDGRIRIYGTEQ